jgi:hypothetical protein
MILALTFRLQDIEAKIQKDYPSFSMFTNEVDEEAGTSMSLAAEWVSLNCPSPRKVT